ncbi:hypothetical protein OX90_18575 [Pseudomonas coronafaciens pv. porri]|uniref:Uncharacterized protein n=1 Tax=Pseudomonas coronafaciens pv. porri TaxID=83964 RepID=A0ABR5JL63_9PSED|nr:hypothetical protein [Pseudomonas coronafaciens]KOP55341.1 hypothetical protein OX90_18575 [Pseudomonas coronafaciens pv. porri]KOP56318.1 hypothetical protein OX88_11155 [Pseudomonas coronafaciens pv. porri]
MDFNQDVDAFVAQLARSNRDIKLARENFLDFIHHWKTLSERKFGGLVIIELLPESLGFTGSILGKGFGISISPIITGQANTIEAVVTVPSLSQEQVEIGRFQMDRDGNLIGDDHPDAGNPFESEVSGRIFTAVLKAALESSVAVKG